MYKDSFACDNHTVVVGVCLVAPCTLKCVKDWPSSLGVPIVSSVAPIIGSHLVLVASRPLQPYRGDTCVHLVSTIYVCTYLPVSAIFQSLVTTLQYSSYFCYTSLKCLHDPSSHPQLDTERGAARELRQRLEAAQRAVVEKTQEDEKSKTEQVKLRNNQAVKATEQVCPQQVVVRREERLSQAT